MQRNIVIGRIVILSLYFPLSLGVLRIASLVQNPKFINNNDYNITLAYTNSHIELVWQY